MRSYCRKPSQHLFNTNPHRPTHITSNVLLAKRYISYSSRNRSGSNNPQIPKYSTYGIIVSSLCTTSRDEGSYPKNTLIKIQETSYNDSRSRARNVNVVRNPGWAKKKKSQIHSEWQEGLPIIPMYKTITIGMNRKKAFVCSSGQLLKQNLRTIQSVNLPFPSTLGSNFQSMSSN